MFLRLVLADWWMPESSSNLIVFTPFAAASFTIARLILWSWSVIQRCSLLRDLFVRIWAANYIFVNSFCTKKAVCNPHFMVEQSISFFIAIDAVVNDEHGFRNFTKHPHYAVLCLVVFHELCVQSILPIATCVLGRNKCPATPFFITRSFL